MKKGDVILEKEHTRILQIQNTGVLPLKVLSIKIDGEGCIADSDKSIKLINCKDFLNNTYLPG